jgi:hypothetical protein
VTSGEVAAARPELQPLGWSRIALGTLFIVRTTPIVHALHFPFAIAASPLLGWPDGRWTGSSWFALAPSIIAFLCVLRTVAAAAFLLGIFARPAGLVAGAAGYLVLLQEPFGFVFTVHLLYLGTLLLALTDAASTLAIVPAKPLAPASGVLLIRLFLASVYAWSGIAKLRFDWLDGRTLALYMADGAFQTGAARTLLATPASRAACAMAVALTELALPVLLLVPRTRKAGLIAAFALHFVIELAARPDLLGWEMGALLLALWPVPARAQGDPIQGRESAGQPMSP